MLQSMNALHNRSIGANDGEIGSLTDLYFDDFDWVVRYLIVDTGTWLKSREVLISPISLRYETMSTNPVYVALTKAQVASSPSIDTDKPVSRQNESDHLTYYGYPNYWDGAGIWGGGMYPYALTPSGNFQRENRHDREQAEAEFRRRERSAHEHDDPHLRSMEEVIGYHLHAKDGDIGHIEDILIDDETWAVRYFVLNTSNWWVGHTVLVSPQWISDISWSDESVSLDMDRDMIKSAPHFKGVENFDREQEISLFEHYGRQGYWPRTLAASTTSTNRAVS
jgi:uncharacterized protein YrrD